MARRRKPQAPSPPPTPVVPDELVDRVVLLLVTVRSRAEVLRQCLEHEKLKLTADVAAAAIAEADRRINLAATCDYDFEMGAARARLADLYQKACKVHDFKTALSIQRELNKLHGLYRRQPIASPAAGEADNTALEQLAAARSYLAPLIDAGDDEPLDEIARRVVARFTSKK